MSHNAVGSMPAKPEEEKIDAPVEEREDEINEPAEDVPSEIPEVAPEASPEVPEGAPETDNALTDTNTAPEGEIDPEGEEPVIEPVNE